MTQKGNIVISDWSAYHLYCHTRSPASCGIVETSASVLNIDGSVMPDYSSFNPDNPLYGDGPVNLLVGNPNSRRTSSKYICSYCTTELPHGSFLKIRNGLYLTSPEFTYVRLASQVSEMRLAEIGTNLCGKFFINIRNRKIHERDEPIVTPEKLSTYLEKARGLRGSSKAAKSLRYVRQNSASPFETKTMLQFSTPLKKGSFNLPFTEMNYNPDESWSESISEQRSLYLDLAAPTLKACIEYDGSDYHQDVSKDKRRRNMLAALGWKTFPLDKEVLFSPAATERFAHQVAKSLGIRIRKPSNWDQKFIELRRDLDLPV